MRLFRRCKHEYLPLANTHGDWINHTKFRTVLRCKKCGKLKYVKEYIEAPLNYGALWNYYALRDSFGKDVAYSLVKDYIFKDKEQFMHLWGETKYSEELKNHVQR